MPFKSWGSRVLTFLAIMLGLCVGAGLKVSTQNPAVIFGNSSGTAQVIKATSNALWVSVSGVLGTLTSSVTLDTTSGNSFRRLMTTPADPSLAQNQSGTDLAAGTYKVAVVCVDPGNGTSLPSNNISVTVGAGGAGRIAVTYVACTGYASMRIYVTTVGGTTPDRYFTSTSATTYNIDTLTGATVAALPATNTAYQFSIGSSPNWFGNQIQGPTGAAATPSFTFTSATGSGLWNRGSGVVGIAINGGDVYAFGASTFVINSASAVVSLNGDALFGREAAATFQLGLDAAGVTDQTLKGPDRITSDGVGGNLTIAGGRNRGASVGGHVIFQTSPAAGAGVAGTLTERLRITDTGLVTFGGTTSSFPALKQSSNELTVRLADDSANANLTAAGLFASGAQITNGSGTGITVPNTGTLRTVIYKVTIAKEAIACNDVTCDVTIGTLPAKTFLQHAMADVTVPFVCGATCTTATLSAVLGKTAGGNQYLLSFDVDAAAAQFGDAAAELGASLAPATVQTLVGDLGAWAGTTAVVARFTSGTGNWGNGTATNLSAGSVTFYLTTTKMP